MQQQQKTQNWHETLTVLQAEDMVGELGRSHPVTVRAAEWGTCAVGEAFKEICDIDLAKLPCAEKSLDGLEEMETLGCRFWCQISNGNIDRAIQTRKEIRAYCKANRQLIRNHIQG